MKACTLPHARGCWSPASEAHSGPLSPEPSVPFQLVGGKIAHYDVLAPLGAGAMSEVYRCRDTRLDKQVALKVIHESVARRQQLVERFEQEARAAARLEHPNVARVHFAGTEDGKAFYAMELVDGWPLSELIEDHASFRWEQYLSLFCQACAGLQAATDAGVCHGDVKPANMLLGRDGTLKLLDFGLARFLDDNTLGHAGTAMGTPYYMAPEVVRGRPGDPRSDLYSLGASFFHLLIGRPPFEADTPRQLLEKHEREMPPYVRDLGGKPPQALASLLAQLLAKAPWDRPPSYREVHARLLHIYDDMADERRVGALRWCGRDLMNSEAHAGECTVCGQLYPKRERPASYHVDVVGWNENDGERAVASFISDALGMATQEVEPLLRPLPYRAAFRLPRERARKMHRHLFELGADVSLTDADEAAHKRSETVNDSTPAALSCPVRWPTEPRLNQGAATGRARRPVEAPVVSKGKQRSQLVVLLSLACLALGLFALDQHLRLSDLIEETEHWREQARVKAAQRDHPFDPERQTDHSEPPSEASHGVAGEADRAEQLGTILLVLENDLGLTDEDILEFGRTLGEVVANLPAAVRLRRGSAVRVVPFWAEASDVRSHWQAAPYAPVIELPLAGENPPSGDQGRALLRYQLSRGALRQAGGPGLPAWLIESIALHLELGDPDEEQLANLLAEESHPTQLRAGEIFDANQELALRSLAAHLLTEHGWEGVVSLLAACAAGQPADAALEASIGLQAASLEAEWLAALRGKYPR